MDGAGRQLGVAAGAQVTGELLCSRQLVQKNKKVPVPIAATRRMLSPAMPVSSGAGEIEFAGPINRSRFDPKESAKVAAAGPRLG